MILYFEDSKGQRRVVSTPSTVKEMWDDINHFLEGHNFKSPYSRINFAGDELIIDVGNHSEFFIVRDYTEEDNKAMFKGE